MDIMNNYAPQLKLSGALAQDCMKLLEVERVMQGRFKASVQIVKTSVFTEILEALNYALAEGYGDRKEGIETAIKNMMERSLIDTTSKGLADTI